MINTNTEPEISDISIDCKKQMSRMIKEKFKDQFMNQPLYLVLEQLNDSINSINEMINDKESNSQLMTNNFNDRLNNLENLFKSQSNIVKDDNNFNNENDADYVNASVDGSNRINEFEFNKMKKDITELKIKTQKILDLYSNDSDSTKIDQSIMKSTEKSSLDNIDTNEDIKFKFKEQESKINEMDSKINQIMVDMNRSNSNFETSKIDNIHDLSNIEQKQIDQTDIQNKKDNQSNNDAIININKKLIQLEESIDSIDLKQIIAITENLNENLNKNTQDIVDINNSIIKTEENQTKLNDEILRLISSKAEKSQLNEIIENFNKMGKNGQNGTIQISDSPDQSSQFSELNQKHELAMSKIEKLFKNFKNIEKQIDDNFKIFSNNFDAIPNMIKNKVDRSLFLPFQEEIRLYQDSLTEKLNIMNIAIALKCDTEWVKKMLAKLNQALKDIATRTQVSESPKDDALLTYKHIGYKCASCNHTVDNLPTGERRFVSLSPTQITKSSNMHHSNRHGDEKNMMGTDTYSGDNTVYSGFSGRKNDKSILPKISSTPQLN